MANVIRVVWNSSSGRWMRYERDGDRLVPLTATGPLLTAGDDNEVHVYRVTNDRGIFVPFAASALHPAYLTVLFTDSSTGALAEKETIAQTAAEEDGHLVFELGDYTEDQAKTGVMQFTDGTVGSIAASFATVTLYSKGSSGIAGGNKILAAVVEGLDNKRVRFSSSDPSVCRIETGPIDATLKASAVLQADQYCLLVGVNPGTCTIICTSEADENLTDEVEVTVVASPYEPADPEEPAEEETLTEQFERIGSGVKLGYSPCQTTALYVTNEAVELARREVVVPGSTDDLFKIIIDYEGTVCEWNEYSGSGGQCHCLFIGLTDWPDACDPPMAVLTYLSKGAIIAADLGLAGAKVINTAGSGTEALDGSLVLFVRGGQVIVFGWAFVNPTNTGNTGTIPTSGNYVVTFDITVDEHYAPA